MHDPFFLAFELNFRIVILQINDHLVNFTLECLCFFIFNLANFEHWIDVVILMNQKVVLSSSHLNGFGNLREHIFNVGYHVFFCCIRVFLTFSKNLVNKVLIFNDVLNVLGGFFMGIDEVNNDIIGLWKAVEQISSEEEWKHFPLRKKSNHFKEPIR